MNAVRQLSLASLAGSILLLVCGGPGFGQTRVALTDDQLDRVTAGGATVLSSSDAAAAAAFALTNTTSNAFIAAEESPFKGQPNLGPTGGVAVGTALAVGTNGLLTGEPPASSATSVQTGGTADGNLVFNSTFNHTTQGAGGVTFQAGWTFVYGAWVGL